MQIWKYQLEITDYQYIKIPAGGEVLCVQTQEGVPCIWVKVNPNSALTHEKFITVGTGHPIPDTAGKYIGTYQVSNGALVFHVFEG